MLVSKDGMDFGVWSVFGAEYSDVMQPLPTDRVSRFPACASRPANTLTLPHLRNSLGCSHFPHPFSPIYYYEIGRSGTYHSHVGSSPNLKRKWLSTSTKENHGSLQWSNRPCAIRREHVRLCRLRLLSLLLEIVSSCIRRLKAQFIRHKTV